MSAPSFGTAIPRHRFQIGPFSAVLLADIESKDERRYRFILAVMRPGRQQPDLFITSEPQNPELERGPHVICLYDGEEAPERLDASRDWYKAEPFVMQALALVKERFHIDDNPRQLA
jgi:hypothetical protein